MRDKRLVELFKQACSLSGSELDDFVQGIRDDDAELAESLAELLGQDGPVATEAGSFAKKLKDQYGSSADPHISLEVEAEGSDFASGIVQRLAGRGEAYGRYRLKGEVARGGQGAILRVWDEDLRRNLAMKVVLGKGGPATGDTPEIDSKSLGRFLEEAQVTGQLDHPGIVPVHELGLDDRGQVYFTMKLVKGQDLKAIFDLVQEQKDDWTQTRALNVLLKVCEAMAYAHSKGVIHRDLKPSNVMVGKFGEAYVMDWGLARVLGRQDEKDIRIKPLGATDELRSERHEVEGEAPDSPLVTMDGDVVGTPAYMPPEQATGDLAAMGPHSDVYAAGAMLYHLLAAHMPYVPPGARLSNFAVWRLVQAGPPHSLSHVNEAPPELVAICEKAMERDVSRRYPNMSALARDLRAFLEGRVVTAHRTGAVVELRKWVERNRALASAIAAGLLALVGGMTVSWVLNQKLSVANAALARRQKQVEEDLELVGQQLSDLGLDENAAVVQGLLGKLQEIDDGDRGEYRELFDTRMVPLVKRVALEKVEAKLNEGVASHPELRTTCNGLASLLGDVDFSKRDVRDDVLDCLPDYTSAQSVDGGRPLTLEDAFERRVSYGQPRSLLLPMAEADGDFLIRLCTLAVAELEACLEPGAPTQPRDELGYMLAWYGAEQAVEGLRDDARLIAEGQAIQLAREFSLCMSKLEEIEVQDLRASEGGKRIRIADVLLQGRWLFGLRTQLVDFMAESGSEGTPSSSWAALSQLLRWTHKQFEKHEGPVSLSKLGMEFGARSTSQSLFQASESLIAMASGQITVGPAGTHAPLDELDQPAGLRRLTAHALPLSFRDGELAGLSEELRFIGWTLLNATGPGQFLFEIFAAQCVQFSQLFRSQVNTPEEAFLALGVDEPRPAGKLSVPLVRELCAQHRALDDLAETKKPKGQLKDSLIEWQRHIELLLHAHLRDVGNLKGWVPDVTPEGGLSPDAWEMLRSLGFACQLTLIAPRSYPVGGEAAKLQREVFLELAARFEARWDERDALSLEETKASVAELADLATNVQVRLPNADVLKTGGDLQRWSARVDSILSHRLDRFVQEVERIWDPDTDRGTFQGALQAAATELASIRQKIEESQRAGMTLLGPIVVALEPDSPLSNWIELPRMTAAADRLRRCRVPVSAPEVENDPEYLALRATVRTLRETDSTDDFGPFLARMYVEDFAEPGAGEPGPARSAGIQLVRSTRKKLGEEMVSEIRRYYLAELEELFANSKYRLVFDVLFWDCDEKPLEYSDVEVRDNLNELLRPKRGDFARLQESYYFTGGDRPFGSLVFPDETSAEEDDWARVHRFLTSLQGFFFVGSKKSLNDVVIAFTIRPEVGTPGSVWSLDSIDPSERRGFFWYPEDDSSDGLRSETIQAVMSTRLRVKGWGFAVSRPDRSLLLLWSDLPVQSAARTDPERYSFEVRTCLAPLLLAWSGKPVDEEGYEWIVELTPERSKRPAPLRLEFDTPLPLRPSKP